jgi:hypothetical protein
MAQFPPPKAHAISAFFNNIDDVSDEDKSSDDSSEALEEDDK